MEETILPEKALVQITLLIGIYYQNLIEIGNLYKKV